MAKLFEPLLLRGTRFPNRIFVSPMCQYSADAGLPDAWHLVHLGSRAVGGAGAVFTEATAVSPEGRISPGDTGIWHDGQAEAWRPVAEFVRAQGAVPGIQLAHAGRKASVAAPWLGGRALTDAQGGWEPVAPSAVAFSPESRTPRSLTIEALLEVVDAFRKAALRAAKAGFQVVELHMAHGYLLHEFLSPLANARTDAYGGSFENRCRLPLEVVAAVRGVWPSECPLFVRISATDWVEGGWDLAQSVAFARDLKAAGVDLVDCSSGAILPGVKIPVGPGFQVAFAEQIRREAGIATGAVGLITDPAQAEAILAGGCADAVLLARALLADPYWPRHAARALGEDVAWPVQYERAIAPRPR